MLDQLTFPPQGHITIGEANSSLGKNRKKKQTCYYLSMEEPLLKSHLYCYFKTIVQISGQEDPKRRAFINTYVCLGPTFYVFSNRQHIRRDSVHNTIFCIINIDHLGRAKGRAPGAFTEHTPARATRPQGTQGTGNGILGRHSNTPQVLDYRHREGNNPSLGPYRHH